MPLGVLDGGLGRLGDGSIELSMRVFTLELVLI
jgi:hypothetical protein